MKNYLLFLILQNPVSVFVSAKLEIKCVYAFFLNDTFGANIKTIDSQINIFLHLWVQPP